MFIVGTFYDWIFFKQTHCDSYFTFIDAVFCIILIAHEAGTMYLLLYCVDLGYFWLLESYLIRHTVLGISLRFISVFLQLYQCKIRHYMLANLLWWFWLLLVIEDRIKKTHCVKFYTKIHSGCFIIWLVHKVVDVCWLIYCGDFGYNRSLKIDLSGNIALAVSIILMLFPCMALAVKKRHYVRSNLLCWFVVHLFNKQLF